MFAEAFWRVYLRSPCLELLCRQMDHSGDLIQVILLSSKPVILTEGSTLLYRGTPVVELHILVKYTSHKFISAIHRLQSGKNMNYQGTIGRDYLCVLSPCSPVETHVLSKCSL